MEAPRKLTTPTPAEQPRCFPEKLFGVKIRTWPDIITQLVLGKLKEEAPVDHHWCRYAPVACNLWSAGGTSVTKLLVVAADEGKIYRR